MRPKTDKEIETMRQAGGMLVKVLHRMTTEIAPGISTKELSDIAAKEVRALGGQPSFLAHEGFPEASCISINDELVHGLPVPTKKIKAGDVVGIDFGVVYKGLVVDGAKTVFVGGKPPADIKRLLEGTEMALNAGIDAISGEGTRIGDISSAVQAALDRNRLGVVRDLVGHGVGDKIHEPPNIPNYGVKGTGPALSSGMTICVEPMATLGDWHINVLPDAWTVVTRDHSLSAHFEHTVLVTDNGAEILTTF